MKSLGIIAAFAALTLSIAGPSVTEQAAELRQKVSAEFQTPTIRLEGTTLTPAAAKQIAEDLKLRMIQQYSSRYKLWQFEMEFTDQEREANEVGIDVNVFFNMLPKGDLSRYPDLRPETTSLYHIRISEPIKTQADAKRVLHYELFDRADITWEETILTPIDTVEMPWENKDDIL